MSYTFVLLHGSWHYGDLYKEVAACLTRDGHTVHTPTAAGHGPEGDPNATMADAVDSIEDYIVKNDITDMVLVGHSWGGTVLTQLAPRVIDRGIKRAVFHNAFVAEHDHSLLDEVPSQLRDVLEDLKDPETGLVELPLPLFRDGFIQDADGPTAAEVHARLSPEPFAMWDVPLQQTKFFDLLDNERLATSYLSFDQDALVDWEQQFAPRLGSPRIIKEPRGSHEVMFTNPQLLARKIIEASRD